MEEGLIAPCGMNCAICSHYLSQAHNLKDAGLNIPYCTGCLPRDKRCAFIMKTCKLLRERAIDYCWQCADFPCARLERLDQRYRQNFHMSMIENLRCMRENGLEKFLCRQKEEWACPKCGGVICCHNGLCFSCDIEKLKKKRLKNRW